MPTFPRIDSEQELKIVTQLELQAVIDSRTSRQFTPLRSQHQAAQLAIIQAVHMHTDPQPAMLEAVSLAAQINSPRN